MKPKLGRLFFPWPDTWILGCPEFVRPAKLRQRFRKFIIIWTLKIQQKSTILTIESKFKTPISSRSNGPCVSSWALKGRVFSIPEAVNQKPRAAARTGAVVKVFGGSVQSRGTMGHECLINSVVLAVLVPRLSHFGRRLELLLFWCGDWGFWGNVGKSWGNLGGMG